MRVWLLVVALPAVAASPAVASGTAADKLWIHGSPDCATNDDPAIDIYRHDADTYILRQNKCVHFEAPFIYVLFGEHTALVLDTGATAEPEQFPIYESVRGLMSARGNQEIKTLVAHSHSHGDHREGDSQFQGKPGVTVVAPEAEAVRKYFGFSSWPQGEATVDLGGRTLTVFPAPGHQDEAIVLYDSRTGWLLTGDNLYPGRLYVRNWGEFRSSVRRMAEFSRTHPVSAVMGAHIEISRTGQLFEAGSKYQPGEAALPLTANDLLELDKVLAPAGDESKEIVTPRFAVVPIAAFWRILGDVISWLGIR
jgi:hydroxyacylglutathione hydrolase